MNKLPFILRAPDAPAPGGGGGSPPAPAPAPSLLGDNPPPAPAPDGNPPSPAPSQLAANWDASIYDATGKLNADSLKSLPADMADLTGFLSKYQTRAEALKAIPHLQKLAIGKAGLRPLAADATPEARAAHNAEVAKLLGVPEKPEGYGVTKPEKLPEGMTWNEAAVSKFTALAHKHNVPPAAVKDILALQQEIVAGELAQGRIAAETAMATTISEMKAELPPGVDWEAYRGAVDRGVLTASRISGIPETRLQEMAKAGGLKEMSQLFAALAAASGEDAIPDGSRPVNSDGIEEQLAKIEQTPGFLNGQGMGIEQRKTLEAQYKALMARKHGYSR